MNATFVDKASTTISWGNTLVRHVVLVRSSLRLELSMDASIAPLGNINQIPVQNRVKDAIVESINLNKSKLLALRVKLVGMN